MSSTIRWEQGTVTPTQHSAAQHINEQRVYLQLSGRCICTDDLRCFLRQENPIRVSHIVAYREQGLALLVTAEIIHEETVRTLRWCADRRHLCVHHNDSIVRIQSMLGKPRTDG